jgi:glycosyltransferase involved in cell wall biosynthesis
MPFFSVIMNCLNGEAFLKKAIDSVFDQIFTDWEIIFFDNGSIDKSVEIAQSYGPKLKIFTNENTVSLGQARQEAIDKANGDFITFLDVDDIWMFNKLQVQYNVMRSRDYDFAYGGVICIDESDRPLYSQLPVHSTGQMFEKQLAQFEVNILTLVLNRNKLLQSNIRYDIAFKVSPDDDFILKFLLLNDNGFVFNEALAKYRVYANSLTFRKMELWSKERFKMLDNLISINPNVKELFPSAFNSAKSRGYYYKARYHMVYKNHKEAIVAMEDAVNIDRKYRLLRLLVTWPWLWSLIHNYKNILAPLWMNSHLKLLK